jgi:hypothetical protein
MCPVGVLRPPRGPASVVLPLVGVIDDELTAGLCQVVRALVEVDGIDVVTCDTSAAAGGVGLVGALVRLQLTARRLGYAIRIRAARADLRVLVELTGLADTLPIVDHTTPPRLVSPDEGHRESEELDEAWVEERVDTGDGAVGDVDGLHGEGLEPS